MDGKGKETLLSIVIEVAAYGVLVTAYFFFVLHFLGDWLAETYHHDKRIYAAVALLLMIGQGVVLEMITTWLLRWIRSKVE